MVSFRDSARQSTETLRRLLLWSLKGDAAEQRILSEIDINNKQQILMALTWIGVIG